jgi:hypothetical protein
MKMVLVMTVLVLTGCSSAHQVNPAAALQGACGSKSDISMDAALGPIVAGRAHGITAAVNIQNAHVPPLAGDQVKFVWRITGTGTPTFVLTGPKGSRATRDFGPEPHGGSNWNAPGDEWGTGFQFSAAGCWQITVSRTGGSAQLWVGVGKA